MAKRFGYDCPNFIGEELPFGERAKASNINVIKAKSFWQGENVIYDIEREVIVRELKKEAEELVRKFRDAGKLDWETVLQRWRSLEARIKTMYTVVDETDKKVLSSKKEEYTEKNLKKSYSVGTVFKVLTFVFILIETIVMLLSSIPQGLEEGVSPDFMVIGFAIFLAVFLAGGGWLVGSFLSVFIFDKHLESNNIAEKHLTTIHWLLLVGGSIMIVAIAITRLVGGGFGLFLFTLILGFIISVMKAFWDYYDGLRCFTGSLRISYFKKLSSKSHEDALKSYYNNVFFDEVKLQAEKEGVIIEENLKEGR